MKANELRIGNWLQDSKGRFYQVNIDDLVYISEVGTKSKPIPITEEWLLRFGFEKYSGWDGQIYWRKKEMDLLVTNQGFEMPSGKICEFVHILQNAYFFTELEELTLKNEL
jgi:hypothetical protein